VIYILNKALLVHQSEREEGMLAIIPGNKANQGGKQVSQSGESLSVSLLLD
jgi:hypothetical protein